MSRINDFGDKTSIVLSALCTLHCIATPMVLLALPSLVASLSFDIEIIHSLLLFAVIPISSITMFFGYVNHRKTRPFAISIIGMMLLILGVVFGHDLLHGYGELLFTIIGSLMIAYSHIKSLKFKRAVAFNHIQVT